jgi:hypothetical protein
MTGLDKFLYGESNGRIRFLVTIPHDTIFLGSQIPRSDSQVIAKHNFTQTQNPENF